MSLIKCPDCGKEFSDKAPACIHCGRPNTIEEEYKKTGNAALLGILAAVIFFGGLFGLCSKDPASKSSGNSIFQTQPAPDLAKIAHETAPKASASDSEQVASECRDDARTIEAGLSGWSEKIDLGSKVEWKLGPGCAGHTPSQRDRLIHQAADADACLQGMKARRIDFFCQGKLVGYADPTMGIKTSQ